MKAYSVLEPPQHSGDVAEHAERFVFVRDGFSLPAFLFTLFWMLWHRMWLVFGAYVGCLLTLELGIRAIGASVGIRILSWLLLHLLIGFEASTLRRLTLLRAGWRDLGVVVADDIEAAERRFFSTWAPKAHEQSQSPPSATPRVRMSQDNDVIGLFPKPGVNR
jgi:Protein of unknown function (DUF2628)